MAKHQHTAHPQAPNPKRDDNRTLLQKCVDGGLKVLFGSLFVAVPLAVTPWNYELFEYNKMMLTYGITAAILCFWILKMVLSRRIMLRRTPLDIPIALFVISQFVSTLTSMDPHISWFGYYSRFNGGMWSVLSYVALYYAFMHTIVPEPQEKLVDTAESDSTVRWLMPFLRVAFLGTAFVAAYAIAQRLGVDKHIWVQDVQNRVFSTLGQPNWLAAYFIALVPTALALSILPREQRTTLQKISRFIWAGMGVVLFVVLLFTRSRSGFVAFVITIVIYVASTMLQKSHTELRLRRFFAVLSLLFGIITFVNGSNIGQVDKYLSLNGIQILIQQRQSAAAPAPEQPASGGETIINSGGTESGEIRKYVWQGAIDAWNNSLKTRLIGTGTETFAFAFFQHKPKEHNRTSEWDFLYNKAHNEYLNFLTTTGIFGLGTYLLLIGTTLVWFIRWQWHIRRDIKKHPRVELLAWALMCGYLSILITNFWGFSVVITQILFFLIPPMVYGLSRSTVTGKNTSVKITIKLPDGGIYILSGIATFSFIGILFVLVQYWRADVAFASGYQLDRLNDQVTAVQFLEKAIQLNPGEPMYHDEISTALAALAVTAADQKNATLAGELAQRAVRQNEIALTISPQNVNFWKSRTKVFYAFSNYDAQYNTLSIQSLEKAFSLSPTDPKIAYNLAILYGRSAENTKAIDILKQAISMKPDYRDAYYALYIFYLEVKQPSLAKTVLEEYLKIDPNDKDFQERLTQL